MTIDTVQDKSSKINIDQSRRKSCQMKFGTFPADKSKTTMHLKIKSSLFPAQGLLTTLGATLILISLALDFSYANLNTYVISYLRSQNPEISYSDWIFVTTSKTFVQGILMPFMGGLERLIGTRLCIFIGCIVYTGSIALTYFAVDSGLIAVVFSISISHGIAFSLMYAQTIGCVIKWFIGKNMGLMSSIVVAGYGFGGAIWIPLETAFVNPLNVDPVPEDPTDSKSDKYFVDKDVLAQVPYMFLLLSGIFAVLQILGLLLIRFPTKDSETEELKSTKSIDNNNSDTKGLTALQTIARPDFWLLWTIFMSVQLMQLFVNSYQKAFGQTFIDDDKYFATVGTLANILNGLSRIFWGKLYDLKGFKFNVSLIGGVSTVATLTFLFMYLLPVPADNESDMGLKVFFGVWLVGFYTFFPGIYASMAPVTQATFGHINYSRDYGLLFTQSMFGSVVLILTTTFLFKYVEYIGMFSICGGIGVLGLLATWLFKEKREEKDKRKKYKSSQPVLTTFRSIENSSV